MKKKLHVAIQEWSAILSSKRVITTSTILQHAETATFLTSTQVHTILKPINTREVAGIMKVATKYKIPVYPVSGGKNWGLGSKVPQGDGVLIDLGLMNKIRKYDETMAYLTVEPGVTFQQAVTFLQTCNSHLMLDTIGSTPDASIIGNTSERGHGMGLLADRFNFVCGLEVVTPTGEVIRTGFESMKGSKLGPLAKWGLGPYIDGLFTQSNLGIITSLTVWLKPKPLHFQSFIFHCNTEKQVQHVMESWRALGFSSLQASLRIFNDVRMISFVRRFPEIEPTPLSDKTRAQMRKKMGIGKWIGIGGLYAPSKQHAQADRQLIEEKLNGMVDQITFYNQQVADAVASQDDQAAKDWLDFMFNKSLLRGNTSKAGINMVYWRKPEHVAINDLHADRCGVLWYCPAIPFTGRDTVAAIQLAEQICKKYGFELNIGFLFISARTLDITGAICYDREIKGEDKRAMRCHNEIMKVMQKKGYSPYRLGVQSMNLIQNQLPATRTLLKQIKKALDPANILAPGRYID